MIVVLAVLFFTLNGAAVVLQTMLVRRIQRSIFEAERARRGLEWERRAAEQMKNRRRA